MGELKGKYPDKTIWLYTGESWENLLQESMLQYIDVLVDGEFVIEEKDPRLLWKGSKNQRVIDVKKSLEKEDSIVPVLHCGDYA